MDGQQRRAWLDRKSQGIADTLSYYLGPTGIPQRLEGLANLAQFTDAGDMVEAGNASQAVWNDPSIENFARYATAGAALALPVVSARGVGLVDDAVSSGVDDIRRYLTDEYGGLNYTRRPDDYVGGHRAPARDGYSAPLHSLAGDIYPDDIYSPQAVQYYGTGNRALDAETMRILQRARNKPDAEVTVYRAVPKGVTDINNGDWVSVNRRYAMDHGESWLDGEYDIIAEKVRAGDLFTDGNSIHEFGWSPLDRLPER